MKYFYYYYFLPGSPRFEGNVQKLIYTACKEAEIYAKYDIGGIIIENMHDIPYIKSDSLGPETVATMTRICTAVRQIVPPSVPCGIQILAAGNQQALAVAQASGCNFIRVEGFVFGHIADEGYIESCAGSLLRYRNKIKADDIRLFTDIKKKHCSHSITEDLSIEQVAEAAEFFQSDGVIITGTATGKEASNEELERVKKAVSIPVIIGSGVTENNIDKFSQADALIIGSHLKHEGSNTDFIAISTRSLPEAVKSLKTADSVLFGSIRFTCRWMIFTSIPSIVEICNKIASSVS